VIRQRLHEARFPEVKTFETFDFAAVEGVSATQIHTLARGEWVTQPENLILAGPIGTGKTHLAIALGVEATKLKRRVLFTRAADLVRQLLEARDARELGRLQRRLEAVSGKSVMGHPETQRMLADIRSGRITAIIFSKLARLARNTRELLEFADIFIPINSIR